MTDTTPADAADSYEHTPLAKSDVLGQEPAPLAASHTISSIQDEIERVLPGAVRGDRDAIGKLISIVSPLITRYCRSKMGMRGQASVTAEDVAQEACIAVLGALPRFEDRNGSFLGFVYSIAFRKVADAFRASARDPSHPVAELPEAVAADSSPEEYSERADLARRLGQLLRVLSPSQREILTLRVVVGLSAAETAQVTGSSPGAVRLVQHRALSRLRREITSDKHYL